MATAINFTTPVGRLVQGSLYTPSTTDAEGKPLVVKSGANLGQPRVDYYVALAIPKVPGQHWAASEWGSKIWKAGHGFMSQAGQMPTFAWKVRDGDSTVPNKKGKKPCEQEGFPGHWIVGFSSGFAPQVYTHIGVAEPVPLPQKDAINLGDFVQINCNTNGNGSSSQPGVYVNLGMVCLAAYGQRISTGPDVSSAGFGGQPLPAGASLTPPAGFAPAAPAAPGLPPVPGVPAAPAMVIPAAPAAPAAPAMVIPAAPGLPVMPNPAILLPPTPPAAAPVHVMLPSAGGASYESLIALGWTDATLVQHGHMAA